MNSRKVISVILLVAMLLFVMVPQGCWWAGARESVFSGCIPSASGFYPAASWLEYQQGWQMAGGQLAGYYEEQENHVRALVDGVNANAEYQSQSQRPVRRLWEAPIL